jgi:hypothetical protein
MERYAEAALAASDDARQSGNKNRAGEVIAEVRFGALDDRFV